jgi:hypothetical protein
MKHLLEVLKQFLEISATAIIVQFELPAGVSKFPAGVFFQPM